MVRCLRSRHHTGFNISLEPGFSVARLCFILAYGGVVAVANLRCCAGLLQTCSTSNFVLTPFSNIKAWVGMDV